MSLSALATALSGMKAAGRRLEVSASNIANARTTGPLPTDGGGTTAYRALDLRQTDTLGGGVATSVTERSPAYVAQADPGSPFADGNGLVAAPNVDLTGETVDLVGAKLAYGASAVVLKVDEEMSKHLLDTFV
jgi:flagellar basal-body rod protein FlgC